MEISRVEIILIMGLVALGFRAVPLLFFAGRQFPEKWDRLLRYLSYALLCSIISTTLFMKGARLETDAAPYRAVALIVAVVIARRTKSAVTGMLVGMALVLALSWMR